VIVSFGGQTPLRLAAGLEAAGVPLLGTQPEAIDLAEDRGRFGALLERLNLKAPPFALANSPEEALAAASSVGYPLLVRPSYVLGGRSMELAYDDAMLEDYFSRVKPQGEIFLDRFLENAIEVDVDAICDGEDVWVGGIMQHVEEAGIHSGDSACVLPPHSLGIEMLDEIRQATRDLALALGVVGLINIQYGVYGEDLYVIEANPRASRTVPFVSKATGLPLAKLACRVMLGEKLAAMGLPEGGGWDGIKHVSVKEAVLPFDRFSGTDALLGPEMRSTGEVMGVAADFPTAFAKAQAAVGTRLPNSGTVFLTVTDADKAGVVGIASQLHDLGFKIVATRGTAAAIKRMGIPVETINKIQDGRNNVVDWIDRGDVDLVVNTPTGTAARSDGYEIRRAAVARGVPCITTIAGGMAAARAISSARVGDPPVVSLQELHANGGVHV
jgi:carbamoyl-phosphate synthase large subunit